MPARLNHTIVWCRDKKKSARFLTEVLGLPPPRRFMHFLVVDLANDVSVDYYEEKDEPIALQHLAFLVGEDEFDLALARVRERTEEIWADPAKQQPGRSIITSAAVASTSTTPTAICSRSSRSRTAIPPTSSTRSLEATLLDERLTKRRASKRIAYVESTSRRRRFESVSGDTWTCRATVARVRSSAPAGRARIPSA